MRRPEVTLTASERPVHPLSWQTDHRPPCLMALSGYLEILFGSRIPILKTLGLDAMVSAAGTLGASRLASFPSGIEWFRAAVTVTPRHFYTAGGKQTSRS